MADIKQAAKWMQEGKIVRRAFRGVDGHQTPDGLYADDNGLVKAVWAGHFYEDAPCFASTNALLADDWEIVDWGGVR